MKIIVLGCGLVPRIGGIAPLRKPVDVDENVLRLILGHGSLKPYKVNEDGSKQEVTYGNYKKLLKEDEEVDMPKKVEAPKKEESKHHSKPAFTKPVQAVEVKKEEPKKEEVKPVETKPVEVKKEEKKDDFKKNENKDQVKFKPVVMED